MNREFGYHWKGDFVAVIAYGEIYSSFWRRPLHCNPSRLAIHFAQFRRRPVRGTARKENLLPFRSADDQSLGSSAASRLDFVGVTVIGDERAVRALYSDTRVPTAFASPSLPSF